MPKQETIKYLCVDTDIFIQCCFFEIEGDDLEVLTKLHKLLDKNKVKLLLPEIIKLEFYKRFRTKKDSFINEIIKNKENINKSGILNEEPKKELGKIFDKYIKEKEQLSEKVRKEIESIFKHENTIQNNLKITPEVFINTYKYFFSNERPFSKETRSEREKPDVIQSDCLIIESLNAFLSNEPKYKLFFCSRNKKHFTTTEDDGKLDIHEDIEKKFKNIKYYDNLATLLKEKFGVGFTPEAIKKFTNKNIVNPENLPTEPLSDSALSDSSNFGSEQPTNPTSLANSPKYKS